MAKCVFNRLGNGIVVDHHVQFSVYVCSRCKTVVDRNKEAVTDGYFAYCPEHDEDLFQIECELQQEQGEQTGF